MSNPSFEEPTSPLGGDPDRTRSTAPLAGTPRPAVAPAIPARIGRYTIVRVLGEGGMGTVYEAEQDQPKRAVALKVIRAGYLSPQLLKRFEHESAVLGRLQHPGIAQVYEAGTVQDERGHPVPFFAMEFIRGVPLTEYASSKSLGTRERLDLVARICDAVYHAHQKGVIHRDLKPGNILVDDSVQPKILDFGVARATDSDIQQTTMQTDIGQLIGTVPYMSPEQVGGDPDDLDTRSDVYALGVIAYELLAGRLPYDLTRKVIHEAVRVIREEEPTRLSSIDRTLGGDVETIVAKALEKDKVRRYQSAESLASDIRRYLKDEPIAARPSGTWYQAVKFARRNRGLVMGLAAAFVLLIAGLIGTGYGLKQAITARDRERDARNESDLQKAAALAAKESEAKERKTAESQRDKAEKIAEFMSDTLEGAGPSVALGRDITMLKEMMDAAAARIEKGDLASAPEAELRLRGTIGRTYRELAAFNASACMLEPALALARSTFPGDHRDLANAITDVAALLRDRADLPGAERLCRESLDMWKRLFPGDHPDVAAGLNRLALVRQTRGDLDGAESLLVESLEMKRRLFPGDNPHVAVGLNNMGLLLMARADFSSAEPFFRESLAMRRRLFPGDHPEVENGLNNLATLLGTRGDLAGAELLCRESLEMTRRLHPGDHPDVASSINRLATLTQNRGDLAGAEPLCRESLEMRRRLFPGDHPAVADGLTSLAGLLQTRGDLAGAEPLWRESLEMRRRLFPDDHLDVANGLNNLALLLKARGDLEGAEPLYRESLDMKRRIFRGDHPDLAAGLSNLGSLLQSRGDLAGAEPLYREATGMFERTQGRDFWRTGAARMGLGRVLARLNRSSDAEAELVEAARVLSCAQGVPAGWHAQCLRWLVSLYESWDKVEPDKGYDAKAAEWKAKLHALTPPSVPAPEQSSRPGG